MEIIIDTDSKSVKIEGYGTVEDLVYSLGGLIGYTIHVGKACVCPTPLPEVTVE